MCIRESCICSVALQSSQKLRSCLSRKKHGMWWSKTYFSLLQQSHTSYCPGLIIALPKNTLPIGFTTKQSVSKSQVLLTNCFFHLKSSHSRRPSYFLTSTLSRHTSYHHGSIWRQAIVIGLTTSWLSPLQDTPSTVDLLQMIDFWPIGEIQSNLLQVISFWHGEILTSS
jgi:hypothetical protein